MNVGATALRGGAGDDLHMRRLQRQQSIRFVMMLLLVLTLLDGEEVHPKGKKVPGVVEKLQALDPYNASLVNSSRHEQDRLIQDVLSEHPRYRQAIQPNETETAPEAGKVKSEAHHSFNELVDQPNIFFYPCNITGIYRGSWSKLQQPIFSLETIPIRQANIDYNHTSLSTTITPSQVRGVSMEIEQRGLPFGFSLLRDGTDFASLNSSLKNILPTRRGRKQTALRGGYETEHRTKVSLSQSSGRVTFHLYARPVPELKELSVVEGLVKVYDSSSVGYSSRRDILIRVRGMIVHKVGTVSLFSTSALSRSALTILSRENFAVHSNAPIDTHETTMLTNVSSETLNDATAKLNITLHPNRSVAVYPYPFVIDDGNQSVARFLSPAGRRLPSREDFLEAKAASCDFEIHLEVQEERYSSNRVLQSTNRGPPTRTTSDQSTFRETQPPAAIFDPLQHPIKILSGTLNSRKCNISLNLNATAVKADNRQPSSSATYYSFAMILTCLTQIILLLKQLLFTQAQSIAARVSLVCIGWKGVLDALLCLFHVYLSLMSQDLFTAFASVAFFKLLIFCVIEMRYMAIILQARDVRNSGTTPEGLRRRIASLHLRFYASTVGVVLLLVCFWSIAPTSCLLLLYSFWVPQIARSIVKEDRPPFHPIYVVGISVTRLIAPLCAFWNNAHFLRDLFQDWSFAEVRCDMLLLWVGAQLLVLEGQRRLGPRFMIPRKFLPPKYNYNRALPGAKTEHDDKIKTSPEETTEARIYSSGTQPIIRAQNPTGTGTRKRIRGGTSKSEGTTMTAENLDNAARDSSTFDCVICYNQVDPQNCLGYMLTPCDHLFHKECLLHWMDVKMECPTCRMELPPL